MAADDLAEQLAVAEHDRQQIVEVVGDAPASWPMASELLRLAQLRFE
jgi:hypothetical protein